MIQLSRLLPLTAGLAALAISGLALADCPPADNCPPPVGTAIFDLAATDGGAIPHTYTNYSVNFTAIGPTTDLAFAIREDPAYFFLDNISVTLEGGGPQLVSDGDFSTVGTGTANLTGTPWTYDNNYGVTEANGFLRTDCGTTGGNCWYDGSVGAYDGIDQNIATVAGQVYTLSFSLSDDSGYPTASQITTGGLYGIDVLAYAGIAVPVEGGPPPSTGVAPEIDPASAMSALTLLLGGLTVLRGRKSTTKA